MISFDIFDTLITRKVALPIGIFLCVQQDAGLPEDFVNLRVGAEKDARIYAASQGKEEITLQDIYDLLSERMGRNLDDVMSLEVRTEIASAYPIGNNIDKLKSYIANGEKVVLISDMYLDESVIRSILVRVDSIFKEIPIYVSCNYGKTKQNGSLFLKVAELEKADRKEWVHYGDNYHSDYLTPKMLGIQTDLVKKQEMTTWEHQITESIPLRSNLALQYYIGTAKIIRTEQSLSVSAKIGSSLGTMVLFPYVQWILQQCQTGEINRLYFMARDGYILKKIADIVIKKQELKIETKYIFCSRKALRLEKKEVDKRELLKEYFRQEVDYSDEKFALVDLHGTGLSIEYLVDIIKDYDTRRIKVFYYDLIEKRTSNQYELLSFCSNHTGMSELFCRAPHGATIGYRREGKVVKPCLQPIREGLWNEVGLNDYTHGIELAATKLVEFGIYTEKTGGREVSEKVLEYCIASLDCELLQFLGQMPHCDGIEEPETVFAPKLNSHDIFKIYMWKTIEPLTEVYSGAYLPMSLKRTDKKYLKQKVFWDKLYFKLLGRIIHRIKLGKVARLSPKKKIVIYAAGKNGRALYAHLQVHPSFDVVAWTDINVEKYASEGYPVIDCEAAVNKLYDYVVITIGDITQRQIVKNNLINIGVDSERILFYETFVEKFLK